MKKLAHFLLLLCLCQAVLAAPSTHPIEGIDGKHHSLDEYIGKGKWVVLNIWATNCPYCRAELDTLGEFHARHAETDAIVLGLTLHWPSFGFPDKEQLTSFADDYFIDYPLLMVDGELANKLIGKPVNMIPLTFFYNPTGELVYRINGVVTDKMLEEVMNRKTNDYQVEWAKVIPPVFEENKSTD